MKSKDLHKVDYLEPFTYERRVTVREAKHWIMRTRLIQPDFKKKLIEKLNNY